MNVNLCSKVMRQKPQNVIRAHGTGKCEFMELLQFAAENPGVENSLQTDILKTSMGDVSEEENACTNNGDEKIKYNYESLEAFINTCLFIAQQRQAHGNNEVLNKAAVYDYDSKLIPKDIKGLITNGEGKKENDLYKTDEKMGKGDLSKALSSGKKLFEIEKYIEKTKNEGIKNEEFEEKLKHAGDFQVTEETRGMQTDNKIIMISDESAKIKPQILSQVKDKIIITAKEETSFKDAKTITMQLAPKNLGKLNIKMTLENNELTVEIEASNEETHKILSSGTDELREMLGKTSERVNINVKPFIQEPQLRSQNTEENRQGFHEETRGNHNGQSRHRNNHYKGSKEKKEGIFSELIAQNTGG